MHPLPRDAPSSSGCPRLTPAALGLIRLVTSAAPGPVTSGHVRSLTTLTTLMLTLVTSGHVCSLTTLMLTDAHVLPCLTLFRAIYTELARSPHPRSHLPLSLPLRLTPAVPHPHLPQVYALLGVPVAPGPTHTGGGVGGGGGTGAIWAAVDGDVVVIPLGPDGAPDLEAVRRRLVGDTGLL